MAAVAIMADENPGTYHAYAHHGLDASYARAKVLVEESQNMVERIAEALPNSFARAADEVAVIMNDIRKRSLTDERRHVLKTDKVEDIERSNFNEGGGTV